MARAPLGDACLVHELPHLAGELIRMHLAAPPGDEQQRRCGLLITQQPRSRLGQILVDPGQRSRAQRHIPILVALALTHQDHAPLPIQVGQVQRENFLPPQAAGVQHLENGARA
jgi:hypothetical protein